MRIVHAATLLLSLGITAGVQACCSVGPGGKPVVNADQTVIIVWDQERQTEHFIRKASFRGGGDSVGFLVPTPGRPQLEKSGNEAFPLLEEITAPRTGGPVQMAMPFSCSAEPAVTRSYVHVIEEKTVAGFQTVVLASDSGKALMELLSAHDYAFTPEAAAWAEPYLAGGWYLTAMKVAKEPGALGQQTVAAGALRISFKTDRPLFPYREPDSRQAAAGLGVKKRLLRIYFLAEGRYEGTFPGQSAWSGVARWSGPLSDSRRQSLLQALNLPGDTGPRKFWLTEFEDQWKYGKAPGDLYFDLASRQDRLKRRPGGVAVSMDPTLLLAVGVLAGRWLRGKRRNKRSRGIQGTPG